MTRRGRRRLGAILAAVGAVLAVGVQAVLAVVLWELTVTPLIATVGVPTTFTFRATSFDADLGIKCVMAEIPAAISPGDVWIAGSSTSAAWVASRSGQQVTVVIATGDGSQKLRAGDWVDFALTGVPLASGTYAVPAIAYSGHECVNDARPLVAPPVLLITNPQLSAAPEPTPAPTARTTPKPTPTLAPLISLPSILPALPPLLSTPRPVPQPTTRAIPSAVPSPTPAPPSVLAALPGGSPSTAPSGSAARDNSLSVATIGDPAAPGTQSDERNGAPLALARPEAGEGPELALGPLGMIGGLSVWVVPGAVVGGPGILVIFWVALQAGAVAAWIPAVSRLRGQAAGRSRSPRAWVP